jgi:hypothetical protein
MTISLNMITKAQNAKPENNCQYNNDSVIRALRTVTTFLISDVFDLTPEESMWAAYHIDLAFNSLSEEKYYAIPVPVLQELKKGTYGTLLAGREEFDARPTLASDDVKKASIDDWVDVFMETVLISYPDLRPINEAKIRGYISGVLEELGVSNMSAARGSKYLPNTVMNFLARQSD